jgi:N-acetylmuramoyl-L-alanine amidase
MTTLTRAAVAVAAAAAATACASAASSAAPSPVGSAVASPAASISAAAPASTTSSATPLRGKVIGIDPGHNGKNYAHPSFLTQQIWNGRAHEDCDTTGTSTNGGYSEARFNWRVASYLIADLHRDGAKVVLTRHSNTGFGPCVDQRAKILNRAHPAVSIDIHADGGPAGGRGFAILEPVADGPNNHVIKSSERFGHDLRHTMLADTSMPTSTYDGANGFTHRSDLAGLNLTTEPKVLIEVGNMRNAADARKLTSTKFQKHVADAIAAAMVKFVR